MFNNKEKNINIEYIECNSKIIGHNQIMIYTVTNELIRIAFKNFHSQEM